MTVQPWNRCDLDLNTQFKCGLVANRLTYSGGQWQLSTTFPLELNRAVNAAAGVGPIGQGLDSSPRRLPRVSPRSLAAETIGEGLSQIKECSFLYRF